MPRRDPADPRALFAPLVENLARQGKPLVRGELAIGKGGLRFRSAAQAEQARNIELLETKARLDPEVQAKQEAFDLIRQLTPNPQLRVSPTATPTQRSRMDDLFRTRQTERLGERSRLSQMVGLAPQQPTPTFVINAQGQATPLTTPEGAPVPPRSKVVTPPMNLPQKVEERRALKRAELETEAEVTFEDVRRDVNTVLRNLDKIPAPKSQPAGSMTRGFRQFGSKQGFEPALNEFLTATDAMIGALAQTVGRQGGRLSDRDIGLVSELVKELPFLAEENRAVRIQTINDFLNERGFDPVFEAAPSSASATEALRVGGTVQGFPGQRIKAIRVKH